MKLSRRELLTAGAAVAAGLGGRTASAAVLQPEAARGARARPPQAPNLPIRDYLVREARRITDGAAADLKSAATFNRLVPHRRRQFMDMMGLADVPPAKSRAPVPFEITGVV